MSKKKELTPEQQARRKELLAPIPKTFDELFSDKSINSGLVLNKDEGFHTLGPKDKAFLLAYVYDDKKDKYQAFAKSVLKEDFYSMDDERKQYTRLVTNVAWSRIEKNMGGTKNIIKLMGVDIPEIIGHARRLLGAQKLQVDRNGNSYYSDDGGTQIKALEFLSKISGNYSEEPEEKSKNSLNINFNFDKKAALVQADIADDNMEVNLFEKEDE